MRRFAALARSGIGAAQLNEYLAVAVWRTAVERTA